MSLDARVAELAARDLPLAREILAEAIRIPADHVHDDPQCGLSNHEGPRLEYLRAKLLEIGAIADRSDAGFDAYGNLVWSVTDEDDDTPDASKKVVYFDGHTDTVKALRDQWPAQLGGGCDAYDGLTDEAALDRDALRAGLGWVPDDAEWEHLIFGRGSADQLGGVVAQMIATRIMRELAPEGALKGVIVRSYATTAEEDNDGGGPLFVKEHDWPGAPPERIPDAIVLTEGTGCAELGALGIYRGQRGRMQIEVEVIGRSCHGSMPWEGLNPLEYGAAIIVEAARAYDARDGFLDDPFLGHGTRTASWATLDSPSDCAVPDRFTFRFDRRLTAGESPDAAVAAVESLPAVAAAREAGLTVSVRVPHYDDPTWCGYEPGNPQIYPGWATPEEHPVIQAAAETYRRVVTPHVDRDGTGGELRQQPRIARWIFSTDGVGFTVPAADTAIDTTGKQWVEGEVVKHPAMFGFGPGIEQNTHKIGECMDTRELRHAIALLARFPSALAEGLGS